MLLAWLICTFQSLSSLKVRGFKQSEEHLVLRLLSVWRTASLERNPFSYYDAPLAEVLGLVKFCSLPWSHLDASEAQRMLQALVSARRDSEHFPMGDCKAHSPRLLRPFSTNENRRSSGTSSNLEMGFRNPLDWIDGLLQPIIMETKKVH